MRFSPGLALFMVLTMSFSAHAGSVVRIVCEDEDLGSEVFINDRFAGECPVDAQVAAGTAVIRARKRVSQEYEKVFEKRMRIGEGTAQRVELVMSEPRMTAEAKAGKETAAAAAILKQAEAGDVAAMGKAAELYDNGRGVAKDPVAASMWRFKAEKAGMRAELSAAEAGDVKAMNGMADRYEQGVGVDKDPVLAGAWRQRAVLKQKQDEEARRQAQARAVEAKRQAAARAEAEERERAAREAAESNRRKLEEFSFFRTTKDFFKGVNEKVIQNKTAPGDPPLASNLTTLTLGGPGATVLVLFSDTVGAPSATTELIKLKREAALRAAAWAKPDSMIAKAAGGQKAGQPLSAPL